MQTNYLELKSPIGYSPIIGTLVAQLTMTKHIIVMKIQDLTVDELDQSIPFHVNSIGTLLKHMIAIEKKQQTLLFKKREFNKREQSFWKGSLPGQLSWGLVSNNPINYYFALWNKVRSLTLKGLKSVNDNWLYEYPNGELSWNGNHYYCLFHFLEDQLCHYGQIRGMIKIIRNDGVKKYTEHRNKEITR